MKKIIALICSVFIIFTMPYSSLAQENKDESITETLEQELNKLDLTDLEKLKERFNGAEIIGNKSVKEMILEFAGGSNSLNAQSITDYLVSAIIIGTRDGIMNMAVILLVVIMCGLLKNMMGERIGEVSKICEYISFVLVVYILLGNFIYYVDLTKELIEFMQSFVRIIFPPLLTLMTAVGGISSVGVFQPAMAVLSGSMIEFMRNTILPVGIFGGATGILGGISSQIKLGKLSDFCSSMCKWLIGIAFTVYAGLLSIQGVMASTYDGIYFKTAKYTVNSFLPIVGGVMSDTMDTMLGCSLLLKNAIGFTGMIIVTSACLIPLLRYISCILACKLLRALIDTATESKISDAVGGLVSGVTTMFAIVCVITGMTFITVALAINAGNTSVMLR